MKELKNIDRLFQEKFRDFEQTPPKHVWKNISASLAGKTEGNKRVLWLWLSGVAAGLALLLILNKPFERKNKPNHHTTETNDATILKPVIPNSEVTDTEPQEINIYKDNTNTNNQKENTYRNKTTLNKTITNNPTEITYRNKTTLNQLNLIKTENQLSNTKQNNKELVNRTKATSKINPLSPVRSEPIASNNLANSIIESVIKNTPDNPKNTERTLVEEDKTKTIIKIETKKTIIKKEKQVLVAHTDQEKQRTSIKEPLINKEKEETTSMASNSSKKWTLSTTVAPVYFDAFDASTSSFGSKFDKNKKQGQFSTAYGVQVAYQVSDRFSIQTGLHKLDYGYKTNEVFIPLNQLATNRKSTLGLNNVINIKDFKPPPNPLGEVKDINSGSLLQVFGYFEIPIEIKYQLIKGKLGVDLISGFSTLIRSKDEIYYLFDEFSEKLDETSNLNAMNLTGNIGFKAHYELSKNIYFNITPMFKAHANTFTKEAGKNNPYAIAVYSGLNYRF